MKVKCKVRMYDPEVTTPPLQFIDLGEFEIEETEDDYLGEERSARLFSGCRSLGLYFKFYSLSRNPDYKYNVVVYNPEDM